MDKIRLGKTGLYVTACSFGALPIQRVKDRTESTRILRRAYEAGVNFFDTANAYTDSEEKLGLALSDVRQNIIIATKSGGKDKETVRRHIENSLRMLKTDYIDIFQFHNPAVMPDPNDPEGPFAAALEAKEKGYIRHIGITNHRLPVARQAIASGYFETLQFPFSYLASETEIALYEDTVAHDMGFIAMKALAGGLLTQTRAIAAFFAEHPHAVPIFGVQRMTELEDWLALYQDRPAMTPELREVIDKDKLELAGNFCRSCGYCLPCPANIDIPQAARMYALLRRAPNERFMTEEYAAQMHRIDDCIGCRACASRCPYELDTPNVLKRMLADYDEFRAVYLRNH